MISLERRRSCSAYRELELRISQTGCSDFTNKMFGFLKQDVRSLNTMLKVSQEQKGSDIEH